MDTTKGDDGSTWELRQKSKWNFQISPSVHFVKSSLELHIGKLPSWQFCLCQESQWIVDMNVWAKKGQTAECELGFEVRGFLSVILFLLQTNSSHIAMS